MDIIDAARRALFEHTFRRDGADPRERAAFLRRVGVPEEWVAGFCQPGLHAGMALGGAHVIDVQLVVEQVLARQKAGAVTIRVARDRHAEGHLRIEVVEVGPTEMSPGEAAGPEEPIP